MVKLQPIPTAHPLRYYNHHAEVSELIPSITYAALLLELDCECQVCRSNNSKDGYCAKQHKLVNCILSIYYQVACAMIWV